MLYDVSRSGVAILTNTPPATGSDVIGGSVPALVVRQLPMGFAVQFATPFDSLADALAQLSVR